MDQRKRSFVDIDSQESDDGDVQKKDRRSSTDNTDDDDADKKDVQQSMMEFVMDDGAGNSLQGQPIISDGSSSIDMTEDIQEEESSPLTSYAKAMNTLEVIGNIAKYLKPADLTNLRLTCKTWNKALIPELRKRHTFIHLTDDNMTKPWWSKKSAGEYFTNYIHETKDNPFTRYHIDGISFNNVCFGYFFGKCGEKLTCLQISVSDDTWLPISVFRNIIFNATPCLEELTIEDNRERRNETHLWLPFWEEDTLCDDDEFPKERLCSLALKSLDITLNKARGDKWKGFIADLVDVPCLQYLKLYAKEDKEFISDVMAALEVKTELKNLKMLDLNFLPYEVLETLISLSRRESNKLVLTDMVLALHDLPSEDDIDSLEELLGLQSNSLLVLDLYFDDVGQTTPDDDGVRLVLPQMVNLKILVLGLLIHGQRITFDSFVNNFPALTKLDYGYYPPKQLRFEEVMADERLLWDQHMNNPSNQPLTTLQRLKAYGINHFDKLEHLRILFPCINKLYIELINIELLCNVWTTPWLHLQTLKVRWSPGESAQENLLSTSSMADEYLTGIPHEEHSLILKMINGGYAMVDLSLLKTKPGLTDMKSLRRLELDLGVSLTDISAYYGFGYQPTNLTSIYIYKADQISKICREVVQKKLGPLVNIQYGDD